MIDPIRTTGSGLPVVMVHGLFGVVAMARHIAEAFGPEHPFFAVYARARWWRSRWRGCSASRARSSRPW